MARKTFDRDTKKAINAAKRMIEEVQQADGNEAETRSGVRRTTLASVLACSIGNFATCRSARVSPRSMDFPWRRTWDGRSAR